MTRNYTTYPELSGLYLEDSYVLEIAESPTEIRFKLEAVLTRAHPAHHDPLPGEQHCYAHGNLIFPEVIRTNWIARSFRQFPDATGSLDYGNIDSLTNNNGAFIAQGDWGRVRIWTNSDPRFVID